ANHRDRAIAARHCVSAASHRSERACDHDRAHGLRCDLGHALVRGLVRAFARGFADFLVGDLVGCLGPRDCAATRRGWVGWNSARRSRRNSRDGGGGRRRSRPCLPPAPPQAAMALSTWVAAPLILASITRETRLGSLADKGCLRFAAAHPSPASGRGSRPSLPLDVMAESRHYSPVSAACGELE